MKKIIGLILFLFMSCNMSFASTAIDFIYINGSNNNNEKMHHWFLNGINKFHPILKSQLEKDAFTYEHMLKNGKYTIEEKPSNYFWGYKSKDDLAYMQSIAQSLQSVSPVIAYCIRNIISDVMHDAIWVKNTHNMLPILEELHAQIKEDAKQGKKVVLLGYSAGTFITLEYMAQRTSFINVTDWMKNENLDAELKYMIKKYPRKNTCTTAFLTSNLTAVTPMDKVIINTNKEEFKRAYMEIDKYTEKYCIPENVIVGVINYASPIPLFYSDLTDGKTDTTTFIEMMYKHLIEQDFFFLTVNYSDDPLGFPNGVNYKNKELEKMFNVKFTQQRGFFYDYSKELSWRTVAAAHTSYWSASKRFAKAVVKGYTEGYKYQYDK